MTKRPLYTSVFCVLLFVVSFQLACAGKEVEQQNAITIETKSGGPVVFHVELAITPAEQEQGLMNRPSMPDDAGMLFVFNNVARRAFWMKDTLIPLDIMFIAEDGTIHHIHHMAKPLDLTNITSEHPAKAALEMNGGLADILGIAEGDKIIHPVFRNQLPK